MRKQPGKLSASTDAEFLSRYRELAPKRQRELFEQVRREALARVRPLAPAGWAFSDAVVMEEATRLARAAGLSAAELLAVVDPHSYSAYFAHSSGFCSMARLASVDHGRFSEAAEVVVQVKMRRAAEFQHRLVREEFDLHVLFGRIEVQAGQRTVRIERPQAVVVPAGPVVIRAALGSWFSYAPHPLTAWLAAGTLEQCSGAAFMDS